MTPDGTSGETEMETEMKQQTRAEQLPMLECEIVRTIHSTMSNPDDASLDPKRIRRIASILWCMRKEPHILSDITRSMMASDCVEADAARTALASEGGSK